MYNIYSNDKDVKLFLSNPNTPYSELMSKHKDLIKMRFKADVLDIIGSKTDTQNIVRMTAEVINSFYNIYQQNFRESCFTSMYSVHFLIHDYNEMEYVSRAFVPRYNVRTLEGLWNTFCGFFDPSATQACTIINSIYHLLKNEEAASNCRLKPIYEILPYLRIYVHYVGNAVHGKVDSEAIINEVFKFMKVHKIGAFQYSDSIKKRTKKLRPYEF